ncbi:MAG: prepilin-type N-terminal cleavage/methylation domain-containing protein [Defluviitaleaceae bacterium]|nr:prepilin-type N-terminal cleavage/methylation domain-containing protein [Defluviitaleaceae bacterium]
MNQFKRTKGFTLVELIVVIAVLAILAVAAAFAVRGIQRNARRSALSAATANLATALTELNEGGANLSGLTAANLHGNLVAAAAVDRWPGGATHPHATAQSAQAQVRAVGGATAEVVVVNPPDTMIHEATITSIGITNQDMFNAVMIVLVEDVGSNPLTFSVDEPAIAAWNGVWGTPPVASGG